MKYAGVLFVLILLVAPAVADITPSHLEFEPDQVDLILMVVPDGSGPGFPGALAADGSAWNRSLRLRPFFLVWGGGPDPQVIPGFPAEDVMLVSDDGYPCLGSGQPDGPADDEGWFTWTMPVAAGGAMARSTLRLWVAGLLFEESLPVVCTSPDLNGDAVVNLSDVTLFAQELAGGVGGSADFNADGVVNLSDIVRFTPALGTQCP